LAASIHADHDHVGKPAAVRCQLLPCAAANIEDTDGPHVNARAQAKEREQFAIDSVIADRLVVRCAIVS